MKFEPKTDAEIEKAEKERKERWVWPTHHEYEFEIIAALEREGDYGSYIDLEARIYHLNGEWNQKLRDFIGSASPKLKSLCYSVGLGDKYDSGDIEAYEFDGRGGKCKLSVKKDKNGEYPDKNKISDYVRSTAEVKKEPAKVVAKSAELDDKIPF